MLFCGKLNSSPTQQSLRQPIFDYTHAYAHTVRGRLTVMRESLRQNNKENVRE